MTDKELLKLAGKMAIAARNLVGGDGLNGPVPGAQIWHISQRAHDLRTALDAYDNAIIAAGDD